MSSQVYIPLPSYPTSPTRIAPHATSRLLHWLCICPSEQLCFIFQTNSTRRLDSFGRELYEARKAIGHNTTLLHSDANMQPAFPDQDISKPNHRSSPNPKASKRVLASHQGTKKKPFRWFLCCQWTRLATFDRRTQTTQLGEIFEACTLQTTPHWHLQLDWPAVNPSRRKHSSPDIGASRSSCRMHRIESERINLSAS
jgi:hypothetical protein